MDINFTLVMQAVAFGAFIWFTAKFVWPPLMGAIETRQKQIADGLAAGEAGKQSLANAERRIAAHDVPPIVWRHREEAESGGRRLRQVVRVTSR